MSQKPQYALSRIQLELVHILNWVEKWNEQNILKLDRDDLLKNLFSNNNLVIQPNQNNNITIPAPLPIPNNTCSPQMPPSTQSVHCSPNSPNPQNANMRNDKLQTITEEKETQFLDPGAPAFVPSSPSPPSPTCSPDIPPENNNKIMSKTRFIPRYPARAQLNIYIAKDITANLLNMIYEKFPSPETLYYYIDISTALQINDDQMHIFEIEGVNYTNKVVFVNYDLHQNNGTKQVLYGVVIQNDRHIVKQNKWLWKLDKFMSAEDIYFKYGVHSHYLPESSRKMDEFQNHLQIEGNLAVNIDKNIVDNIDWSNIQQIKSLRRGDGKKGKTKKGVQIVARLNKESWIKQCKNSWNESAVLPIVVNENKNNMNQHWIEWVKLIPVPHKKKLYVGVSCKYMAEKQQWIITSICLDKGDIQNKHRLVGLSGEIKQEYLQYFNKFNTTFTEIQWIKD